MPVVFLATEQCFASTKQAAVPEIQPPRLAWGGLHCGVLQAEKRCWEWGSDF